jgi:3-oxoacyl-[acyl-carrier protein] reductase
MNRLDFAGRNAIVTGGAQGIGLAIVERLVASGARVRIWDRDAKLLSQTLSKLGKSATGDAIDVTDAGAIARGTKSALEAFGKIDVLVNNAGIAGPSMPVVDYPVEEWRRVIEVDLTGPFLCCRAVVPHMTKAGYGRIVNIASVAGKEGNPNAAAYSASKAAVMGLTKSLGKELAGYDIAVNCITPATAQTRILDTLTPEFIEYMRSRIPRGRFLEVDEAAAMVAWLVSKENSFTTAATFDLSGGRTTY